MKTFTHLLITMTVLVLSISVSYAADWYVAPPSLGNDGNIGTTVLVPFATIQHAINIASTGDVIHVAAGTYAENVIINKELTLLGAKAGVDPRSVSAGGPGTRNQVTPVGETVVIPGIRDLTAGNIFTVQANNVTIDGFWIDGTNLGGANPLLTSGTGLTVGSTEVFAIHAIYNGNDNTSTYATITGDVFKNNIVKNFADLGISVFNNRVSVSHDNLITHNFVTNLNGPGVYGPPAAISILYDGYSSVIENEVTNSVLGIYTENNHESVQGMSAPVISGNDVSTTRAGIWHNSTSGTAPVFTISDNIMRTWDPGIGHAGEYNIGLWLSTIMGTAQVNVTDNTIMPGAYRGIQVIWATAGLTIHGGSVSGARNTGILVYNIAQKIIPDQWALGSWGAAGQNTTVTLDGVSVSGSATGVKAWDNGGSKTVTMVLSGSSITGGTTGLQVDGALAHFGILGNATISGQSGNYIELINNTGNIDATAVSFDGQTGTTATVAQNYAIEDKIVHKIDNSALGFVRVKANNDYVTMNSFVSPATTAPSIQRGINAATAGDIVNVAAGTYYEQVIIDKAVSVLGAGAATTFIDGTGVTPVLPGLVNITNETGAVTLDGFTIRNAPASGGTRITIWARQADEGPVYSSSMTITHNILVGSGHLVSYNDYGLYSKYNKSNLVFSYNDVSNFGGNAFLFELHTGPAEISHNTITVDPNCGSTAFFSMSFLDGYGNHNDVTGKQWLHHNTINANGESAISIASAWGYSAYNNNTYGAYTNVEITDNVITNVGDAKKGIQLEVDGDNGGFVNPPIIARNTISAKEPSPGPGLSRGIRIMGVITGAQILDNVLTGFYRGIYQSGTFGQPLYPTGTSISGNAITGGTYGVDIAGGTATINGNLIVGNTLFGVNNQTVTTLDATCNWWGSGINAVSGNVTWIPYLTSGIDNEPSTPGFQPVPGSCSSSPSAFYINDVIVDGPYTSAAGNDANTGTAAAPFRTIQHAINLATGGETIRVDAGTYTGNITVNKSLSILGDPGDATPGPGINAPIIDGGSAPGDAFLIANGTTGVTIKGFVMRNFTSPSLDGIGNGISAWVGSTSNITIQDNYFNNLGYNGVLVGNDYSSNPANWGDHTNWLIKNNVIDNFGYIGFELTNTSTSSIEGNEIHMSTPYIGAIFSSARRTESGLTIKNNLIDGTPSVAFPIIYLYAYDLEMLSPNLNSVLIEGNAITALTATPYQIYVRNIGTGTITNVTVTNNSLSTLKNLTAAPVDATCNWWGTAVPSEVAAKINGNVIFLPFWITSTGPCNGLGPVVNVTNDPNRSYMTIQSAIDAPTTVSGDEITVAAGTYTEQITITKALTINGSDGAILDGTGLAPTWTTGVKIKSGNVTFNNIDVTNFTQDGIVCGYEASTPGNLLNIHITNCKVSNIQPGNWGFGIYVGYESEGFGYIPPKLTTHLDYSGLLIENNEITNTHSSALVLQSITALTGTLQVKGNNIHHNTLNDGIWVETARNIVIENNIINNNRWGIEFTSLAETLYTLNGPYGPKNISITGNEINNNSDEGFALYNGWPGTILMNENSIVGNGLVNVNYLALALDVTLNWWGGPAGPYHSVTNVCGILPGVSDYVTYSPWYTTPGMTTTRTSNTYSISGTIKYANNANTPLNGILLTLKKTSDNSTVGTYNTNTTPGSYQFAGLTNNSYYIEISSTFPGGVWQTWGGVNATDYLLVLRHAMNITLLPASPAVIRVAANVINPTVTGILTNDANAIRLAYTYHNPTLYFNIPKWVFSDPTSVPYSIPYNAAVTGIVINCANVVENILALCAGDVNASYLPPSGPKSPPMPNLELINRGSVAASNEITLPVKADMDMELGAITLFLDYDASLFEITGVTMPKQGNEAPYFTVENNVLEIGWASLEPVSLAKGETVLAIHGRVKNDYPGTIRFTLNSNPLSELANEEGIVFNDARLAIADIGGTVSNDMISVYPNPANDVLNIEYVMDAAGAFRAELCNVQGAIVGMIDNTGKPAGTFKEKLGLSNLTSGIYLLRVFRGDNINTQKIIINR